MAPFLLDTNACIQVLNGTSERLVRHLRTHDPSEIKTCSVVRAELVFGAEKSARREQNLETLRRFFEPYESLPFDDACAEPYGEIRLSLESRGLPIGANDLLIAATALANDCTLVTNNVREFSRVETLRIEDWQSAA